MGTFKNRVDHLNAHGSTYLIVFFVGVAVCIVCSFISPLSPETWLPWLCLIFMIYGLGLCGYASLTSRSLKFEQARQTALLQAQAATFQPTTPAAKAA